MGRRARDWGVPFVGTPGRWNAITDVASVEVGHLTVDPTAEVPPERRHWVRTGVTVVLPRGRADLTPVFAGLHTLNGNGELTGAAWLAESGRLEGPVGLTNTQSVGVVRDAVGDWMHARDRPGERWALPVVGETWDGYLNDIWGHHVRPGHVERALEAARHAPIAEGSVGAGTGTVCFGFKGGIGTASREVAAPIPARVGVLVQANHGLRTQLTLGGAAVGRALASGEEPGPEHGSIVTVIATDAPLLPHQLARLARRGPLGLARGGAISGDGSGDFFLAFSTAPQAAGRESPLRSAEFLENDALDPLFTATIESIEEVVANALVAGTTTVGYRDHRVEGFPIERVVGEIRPARAGAEPTGF